MKNNVKNIGIVKPQIIKFNHKIDLVNGRTLNSFELMVETYGHLNPDRSNAVLVCHALTGNHHVAGCYSTEDKYPGWWDNMVGPGKPIDTNKFFVIGLNNLGGCDGSTGPLSINPDTDEIYGAHFPIVTVKDWVKTQILLIEHFGIQTLAAVVGGSLGGMQAIQWSIDYPERLKHAIVIAAAPKLSAQNIAFNDVARQAILKDPNFYEGFYYQHNIKPKYGLSIARMMGHITYLAEYGLNLKFGRELRNQNNKFGFDYNIDFEVESYLRYQGEKFAERFDANTYLLMTKALDYFDPAKDYNDSLESAFENIKAKFLVVSFSSDWRFSPQRSLEIVKALVRTKKELKYIEIESNFGHDAFLMKDPDYFKIMKAYMEFIFKGIH